MKEFLLRLILSTLAVLLHMSNDVAALLELPFQCPPDGNSFKPYFRPHLYSCRKFIMCLNRQAHVFECSSGLLWNQGKSTCDYPANADCNIKNSNCPKGLFYGDDNDCSKFYICNADGSIQKRRCPHNLHWNQLTKQCDWPTNVECKPSQIVNGAKNPLCPIHENPWHTTHLPYPGDCSRFLKCSHGHAWKFSCPHGLHWSVEFDRCEYPDIADCNNDQKTTSTAAEIVTETTESTERSESTRLDGGITSTTEASIDTTTPEDLESTEHPKSTTAHVEFTSTTEVSIDTTTTENPESTTGSESTGVDVEITSTTEVSIDTTTTENPESTTGSESTGVDVETTSTSEVSIETTTLEDPESTTGSESTGVDVETTSTTEASVYTTTPEDPESTIDPESTTVDGEITNTTEVSIDTTTSESPESTKGSEPTVVSESTGVDDEITSTTEAFIATTVEVETTRAKEETTRASSSSTIEFVTNAPITPTPSSDISTTTLDARLPYKAPQCEGFENAIKFSAEDCTKYYQCFGGYAYLLNCYDGYVFNITKGDCVRSETCVN